ncbi:hypothetical protein C8T65DRAFT_692851 [Cerioporus squamosus]|nr:hypothetical protein C8T65DRAFT_692851 [Cerioporus squamosus]
MSQRYDSEVPVATDDDTTLKGTPEMGERRQASGPQRERSDSLPPSSPISVPFTDNEEAGEGGGEEPATPKSFDSAPYWEALGSIPRVHAGPAAMQFDDHESVEYEDGEVEDYANDARGPPSNQEQNRTRTDVRGTTDAERREYVLGEPPVTRSASDALPTASKRPWTGSPVSEELNRSSRRPKHDASDVHQNSFRLPPIQEMLNPWGRMGGGDGHSFSLQRPVTVSTPQRAVSVQNMVPTPSNYANMSGQPPTPFSFSSSSHEDDDTFQRGRVHTRRSLSRTNSSGAGLTSRSHHNPSPDGLSLLDGVDRRGRANQNLHDVLSDPEPETLLSSRNSPRHETNRWPGGYAPAVRGALRGDDDFGRRPTIEGLGRLDDGEAREGMGSFFSAIPNTKAWAHKTRNWRQADPFSGSLRDEDERMNIEEESAPHEHASVNPEDQGQEGGRSYNRRGATEPGGAPEEWSATYEDYGAVPSAMAADEEGEDTPVLPDAPLDSRWSTHFDDPETIVGGQSGEWTRVLWKDKKPIVLFTVFNYKFTKDGAINRHIEASVTTLTTYLTGEKRFYVVPPDPDWSYAIKPRDLPFVWVIRGLTEAGAKTMTSLRTISTRAVSIITYPRVLGNPRWVCGLVGFMRPDADTIRAAVLHVLRADSMLQWLEDLTRTSRQLEGIPQDRRVNFIVDSVRIKIAAAEDEEFVANVYIFPPTDDMGRWREWAAALRASRFNIFLNGAGTARKIFWCAGCRGVDHEAGECPFPKMAGWKGPRAGERSHTRELIGKAKRGGVNGGRGDSLHGAGAHTFGGGRGRGMAGGWELENGRGRGGGGQRGAGQRGVWQSRMPARGWAAPRGFGRGGGSSGRWN